MPNFAEVSRQIEEEARRAKDPHDLVRQRFLNNFAELTDRNVVACYSGWLQHPGP